ncbi:MAG TPA: glycosyltransferase family 1 protein [Anaerolineae bacterium]|nr:glycosyltransferase family 1 protein [Anaerolineae bacterium]HIP72758.1 glycosyltransferase family 1 protein [Anaerolineae bacterium]
MKILHVVQAYHPVVGGAEGLMKHFSEQLANRHQDEVTVFTAAVTKPAYFWRDEGAPLPAGTEITNGVTVRRFPVFKRFQLARMVMARGFYRLKLPYHDWARTIQVGPIIPQLPQAIAQSGVDVVMAATFPFLHMYYAISGGQRGRIPVVLTGAIHTEDKWGYDRQMMIRAIAQADAYIALTAYEKTFLVEKGIAAEKIHVIGGGVAAARFVAAEGTAVRQKYGLGDDPVIVVMSRQSELKRLDTVIQAMPRVWAVFPQARLLMAGARTAYSAQLDGMIARLPPEQRARITQIHDFPEEEKPSLLAAADIFVHPSGNESFGIVFVEAWAVGKPVIGANVGAVASLIAAGRDGLLFEHGSADSLAEAALTLLADAGKRAVLGAAGRQKVLANYTWEIVSDRLRDVYRQAVGRNCR